jgi:hypothetical protein
MNVPFTLALGFTILALILHAFTFEHWIWPKLKNASFPTTPFTDKVETKSLFRVTWYFYAVMLLMTIGALAVLAFVDGFAGENVALARYLGIQWILILGSILVNTYVSLKPDSSYIASLVNSSQWLIALVLVVLIFWGIRNCH